MENIRESTAESTSSTHLDTTARMSDVWFLFGKEVPKAEVEYFCQICLIYIVVICSIINLSLGQNTELFMTLLGMCLGAILPAPQVKKPKIPGIARQS